MKKKLQKKKKVEVTEEYNPYVTHMEYFATGEGMTQEVNFCYASDKKEAIEKHLNRFTGFDIAARDYFRVGIVAYDLTDPRALGILKMFFVGAENIIDILKRGGMNFQFKFHYNFS